MILSFNPRFRDFIADGSKIHTIRADKKDRWKPGKKIHFATGVRTKKYDCFKIGECKAIQHIEIVNKPGVPKSISIDSRKLSISEMNILAQHDGFKDLAFFFSWFNSDFQGKIIHWTTFKY